MYFFLHKYMVPLHRRIPNSKRPKDVYKVSPWVWAGGSNIGVHPMEPGIFFFIIDNFYYILFFF